MTGDTSGPLEAIAEACGLFTAWFDELVEPPAPEVGDDR